MDPLLYYRPGTCALSELIVLEWIGRPYRLCRVTRPQQQSPEFLALNPHGAVPVMTFDDVPVYENNALLAFLGDTHPDAGLCPAHATLERALMDQWLAYLDSGFHAAHVPIFKPTRFAADEADQAELVEFAKVGVAKHLEFLNRHLEGKSFMLGDSKTVLDAYMAAMARWGRNWFDYAEDYPELHRYLSALDEDPAVAMAKAIEKEEDPDAMGHCTGHVPFEG